jgi:RNA polymerase sigma-70 factor (ECF subfamily)
MFRGEAKIMQMRSPAPRLEGLFDVRYKAFLETVAHVRARLHRYCSRMTGSPLDGEDVMQEALLDAYKRIETLDDVSRLQPWLFRIAHNRCIDFLRGNRARGRAEIAFSEDAILAAEPAVAQARHAIERLVIHLPPKEAIGDLQSGVSGRERPHAVPVVEIEQLDIAQQQRIIPASDVQLV